MRSLRDLTIKRQLGTVVMLASTIAILVATAAFLALDLIDFREKRSNELVRIAEVVAASSAAAVAARDRPTLETVLATIAADARVAAATVVGHDGEPLATRGGTAAPDPGDDDRLRATAPIRRDGHVIGTVRLVSPPLHSWTPLERRGLAALVAVAVALALGFLVSSKIQKRIAAPIQELVRLTKLVSQKRGYSSRAGCEAGGELGTLVRGFNEMLEQIERRDKIVVASRDKAEAATRAKSEFLATMSHEIRTPLNAIVGIARLVADTDLSESQASDIATVLSSAEHLLHLLDDILDFSKVEAGKLEIEARNFDLRRTIEVVAGLFAPRAEAKGLELVTRVPASFRPHLRSDDSRLRQILTNLVGNALKFTNEGEIVVSAGLRDENEQGALVRVEVSDTGIGIGAEARRTLFQPFAQADSSTTRKYGGTGLGLVISKQLVELLGGKIGVRSREGRGSVFWFEVRLRRTSDLETPQESIPQCLSGIHSLVVESHDATRDVLVDHLTSFGARVDVARDAETGMRMLRGSLLKDVHELVFLGTGAWNLDETKTVSEIRSHYKLNATRVLVAAYPARLAEGKAAGHPGIDGWVAKPVAREPLLQCLTATLAPGGARGTSAGETAPPRARPAQPRILLAEDNLINQMVAVRMLDKLGYDVTTVVDGRAAVEAVAAGGFDAVLMDCQMPEMDGYEATGAIRRLEGAAQHVPIIALTANALRGDRERCLVAGMDDHLAKPVKPGQLDRVLAKWVASPVR